MTLRVDRQRALVFVVSAPRGSETAGEPSFHGGLVGREECVRGADLEVRVGVVRVLAESFVGKGERAIDVGVEGRVKALRGWRSSDLRSSLAEIVLRRDGSLAEERVNPHRRSDEAIGSGMSWVSLDGGAKCGDRVVVVQVVAEVEAARAQRGGGRSRSVA